FENRCFIIGLSAVIYCYSDKRGNINNFISSHSSAVNIFYSVNITDSVYYIYIYIYIYICLLKCILCAVQCINVYSIYKSYKICDKNNNPFNNQSLPMKSNESFHTQPGPANLTEHIHSHVNYFLIGNQIDTSTLAGDSRFCFLLVAGNQPYRR
ncbi:hypothetical protein L9F63_013292, partial [Diploptera punctata]